MLLFFRSISFSPDAASVVEGDEASAADESLSSGETWGEDFNPFTASDKLICQRGKFYL